MAGREAKRRNGKDRAGRYYLKYAHIDAYGAFSQRDVGPFKPGLNVVYGPNESGKTTVSSLIGGVLFGWGDARSGRNVYKPRNAERSGALVFASSDGSEADLRLTRVRNAEGIQEGSDSPVLVDIDRKTYESIFSFDSDELRSLGRTSDITARLLTAGSGTAVSPAEALGAIDARLSACTSRGAAHVNSIPNLQAAISETREQVAVAQREADRFKQESAEREGLLKRRDALKARVARLDKAVQTVSAQREAVGKLAAERDELLEKQAALAKQEHEVRASEAALEAQRSARYLNLGAVEERTLAETIDEMADERSRREHAVTLAEQELVLSQAGYEALRENDDVKAAQHRVRRQRLWQLGLSVVLPAVFAILGVLLFVHGRDIGSLSYTALGAFMVVAALGIAGTAFIMLMRPDHVEETMQNRLTDAEWVVRKDQHKLDATRDALDEYDRTITAFLNAQGMQAAQGSLKRARALMDEANDLRAEATVLAQSRQSLVSQRSALADSLSRNEADTQAAYAAMAISPDVPASAIDERLSQLTEQRDDLQRTLDSIGTRLGELGQILSAASRARDFDRLKLDLAMLQTRLDDAMEEYARLLIARNLLVRSIAAWEGKSQPAVYVRASRLLAEMTGGAWCEVRVASEGGLAVADEAGNTRTPDLLSLGTCQQLYLALRIALLQTADNVGRSIPVLADDILVNFDDDRRGGACRALASLAQSRQVIIFTCHREVVALMQDACKRLNVVEL